MKATHTPGAVKKFCRTSWRFQQTVERPAPNRLPTFAATIFRAHGGIAKATITIDEIIFDVDNLIGLCPAGSALSLGRDLSISADTPDDLQALLVAALMDNVDFIFIPTPKPFVVYADHDNWITFYANTTSNLNHTIGPLEANGFNLVPDWERKF